MSTKARLERLVALVAARAPSEAMRGAETYRECCLAKLQSIAGEGTDPGPLPPAAAAWEASQPARDDEEELLAALRRAIGHPDGIAGEGRSETHN